MKEETTTGIFLVVALVALGFAWWSRPEVAESEDVVLRDRIGEEVFADFQDPEAATSMQIVKYDEELAQLKRFEVARDKDSKIWTLPSNGGYPADAAEQVQKATTPLIGLEVLNVVSALKSDHELYGVINPDDQELAAGASGVGMLVSFKNDSDQELASLVIGKEVAQAENQRYVRISNEDAVYQVELDVNAFTTEFRDWIEGELLGVRSMDITNVGIRDYSIRQTLTQVIMQRNFNAELTYDSTGGEWSLDSMTSFASGTPEPSGLAEGEQLNTSFLNGLRTAVQDLEIIDVQRKPNGLAADLKADDSLLKDKDSVASLQQQGFFAADGQDGTEIFAAGGETIIGTENGVQYVLRFGEALASMSSLDSDAEDSGISRYLLVTAKLDESKFPMPELEVQPETVEEMLARERAAEAASAPMPELNPADIPGVQGVEGMPAESEESAQEAPAEVSPAEETTAEETGEAKPESTEPAEEKASGDKTADDPAEKEASTKTDDESSNDGSTDTPAIQETSTEEAQPAESEASNPGEKTEESADDSATEAADESETGESEGGEEDSGDEGELDLCGPWDQETEEGQDADGQEDSEPQTSEEGSDETANAQSGETTETDEVQTPEPTTGEPEETEEELKERLEALRESIARENQRKIDERNDKIDAARKKVLELNARFSDWYYVVSDSVYKKLKVSRADLIEKADAADANAAGPTGATGLPDFSQGIPGLPQPPGR